MRRLPLATHRETYVWYQLDTGAARPRPTFEEGFALVEVGPEHEPAFHALGSTSPEQTAHYREQGGRPWLVTGDGEPAFACWIHPRRAPLRALRGGFLDLPEGVASLEDSVTAPAFRGRGVAPRAWTALADVLGAEGVASLVTKVRDDNTASRKAVEKAGFREVARMDVLQNGPVVRLRARASAGGSGGGTGPALAARLDGARALVRD